MQNKVWFVTLWAVAQLNMAQRSKVSGLILGMCRMQRILNDLKNKAFSQSYDLAPLPPPPHVSKLSLFLSRPVCLRSSLLMGEGGSQIIGRR